MRVQVTQDSPGGGGVTNARGASKEETRLAQPYPDPCTGWAAFSPARQPKMDVRCSRF
jgi:hypothetical protein